MYNLLLLGSLPRREPICIQSINSTGFSGLCGWGMTGSNSWVFRKKCNLTQLKEISSSRKMVEKFKESIEDASVENGETYLNYFKWTFIWISWLHMNIFWLSEQWTDLNSVTYFPVNHWVTHKSNICPFLPNFFCSENGDDKKMRDSKGLISQGL